MMRKGIVAFGILALVSTSGCFFLGFKQLMVKGYEKGLAGSTRNFDKMQAAAKAEGWLFKRKQGTWNNDYDLVVYPQSGKELIFQANAETNIIAYNCRGWSKSECKASLNKILLRAFGVSVS